MQYDDSPSFEPMRRTRSRSPQRDHTRTDKAKRRAIQRRAERRQ